VLTVITHYNVSLGYGSNGTIALATNYTGINQTNISYTYKVKEEVLNATIDSLSGTKEIAAQTPTMGIVAAMVIILMMIGGLATYFALR